MSDKNVLRRWVSGLIDGEKMDFASSEVAKYLPVVDDQGAINIGDGTTDMDFKVFLGAAGAYFECCHAVGWDGF
jgi:hypothetical protein